MFQTFIVQPIFNILVLILALLPGHNFGLALVIFTALTRILMWPLIKKQLHHARAMRDLQPELKKIKQAAGGNKQQESMMVMQLYKEREINPFSGFGLLIVQFPILIALYSGINKVVNDPRALVDFSYPFVQNLSYLKELAANIGMLDQTLFGLVDLTKRAYSGGNVYWPAMLIVAAGSIMQYYQSKQLLPEDGKQKRRLRDILKEAGAGKQADQSEVSAVMGQNFRYLMPVMIFVITVNLPAALALYFLVSGGVAIIQQTKVLNQDKTELVKVANKPTDVIEGEIIEQKTANKHPKSRRRNKKNKRKGRR